MYFRAADHLLPNEGTPADGVRPPGQGARGDSVRSGSAPGRHVWRRPGAADSHFVPGHRARPGRPARPAVQHGRVRFAEPCLGPAPQRRRGGHRPRFGERHVRQRHAGARARAHEGPRRAPHRADPAEADRAGRGGPGHIHPGERLRRRDRTVPHDREPGIQTAAAGSTWPGATWWSGETRLPAFTSTIRASAGSTPRSGDEAGRCMSRISAPLRARSSTGRR